jgi:hypothetical protein
VVEGLDQDSDELAEVCECRGRAIQAFELGEMKMH